MGLRSFFIKDDDTEEYEVKNNAEYVSYKVDKSVTRNDFEPIGDEEFEDVVYEGEEE